MKAHEESHAEKKELQCGTCQFKTQHTASLYTHTRRFHKQDITNFKCDQCNKKFTSKASLTSHGDVRHKGLKKFKCEQCDFKSGYADSLKYHVEREHEKLKVQCSTCLWQGNKKRLLQHERTHKRASLPRQESENHKCNICSKDYTRKDHLQKHMERAHLGIRYSCPSCEHKATTKGNLKVHIQSKHEGVKKLCNQCDYKAYDKPSLTKHVKAVHLNLKTHKCPSCDFKTSLVEYLSLIHISEPTRPY